MMNKPQKRSSAAVRMIGCVAGGIFLSILISARVALAEGYTGKGAGIGAFMGLVFGDHPWDVAEGAITGAVVGGVADSAVAAERQRAAEEQRAAATQQRLAEQERQIAEQKENVRALRREMAQANKEQREADDAIVGAIGKDNWEGYKALRACNHERAYALAGAGGTSSNKNHRLASIWLEASTAVDRKEPKRAQAAFKRIVQQDPDIDSVQQAGIECDKIVLGMRQERRELGLGPCR